MKTYLSFPLVPPSPSSTPPLSDDESLSASQTTNATDYRLGELAELRAAINSFPYSSTLFGDWFDSYVEDSTYSKTKVGTSSTIPSRRLALIVTRVSPCRARSGTKS